MGCRGIAPHVPGASSAPVAVPVADRVPRRGTAGQAQEHREEARLDSGCVHGGEGRRPPLRRLQFRIERRDDDLPGGILVDGVREGLRKERQPRSQIR
ncbi:hypothetical protein SDC9_187864 [bioreactor metagenome]|uniref:Uncharacterized protein n=1 Tax=bioreactor metagenome TaxID=1076179 RepID=A0A645HMQ8_9ZZZZ